jgi:hypothetical protein
MLVSALESGEKEKEALIYCGPNPPQDGRKKEDPRGKMFPDMGLGMTVDTIMNH